MGEIDKGTLKRLSKLIPLLASDHGGEVAATGAAIVRTLKAAGLSLHDLADRISRDPCERIVYGDRPQRADEKADASDAKADERAKARRASSAKGKATRARRRAEAEASKYGKGRARPEPEAGYAKDAGSQAVDAVFAVSEGAAMLQFAELSDKERDFVKYVVDRAFCADSIITLTERQGLWFQALIERSKRRAADTGSGTVVR